MIQIKKKLHCYESSFTIAYHILESDFSYFLVSVVIQKQVSIL